MEPTEISALLQPFVSQQKGSVEVDWPRVYDQLASYLDLILKWNARVNLTAIREPEEIVRRHFGESLFAGLQLAPCTTLLDFGSGAGFPGLPIQLVRPDVKVTLGESRHKKAAFLHEVVRMLGLKTEVWSGRVESMEVSRTFDVVTLRAVDDMESALSAAAQRVRCQMVVLGTAATGIPAGIAGGFREAGRVRIPLSDEGRIITWDRMER